jgi:hypothetical protein
MAPTSRRGQTATWQVTSTRCDQTYRHMSHGPILPMEEPGFLEKLFGRR